MKRSPLSQMQHNVQFTYNIASCRRELEMGNKLSSSFARAGSIFCSMDTWAAVGKSVGLARADASANSRDCRRAEEAAAAVDTANGSSAWAVDNIRRRPPPRPPADSSATRSVA